MVQFMEQIYPFNVFGCVFVPSVQSAYVALCCLLNKSLDDIREMRLRVPPPSDSPMTE